MPTTLSHLNSCSPIHHQISVIFLHPNNTTITHSFPQPTITCHFLHYSPGACGTKAHAPWRQCKTHGQYSQITHTHSPCQQLSATSYTLSLEHMDSRHSLPWRQYKTHGQYSQNNSFDDRSLPFHMEHKSHATDDSESHNAGQLFIGYYQEHQAQNSYLYIFSWYFYLLP